MKKRLVAIACLIALMFSMSTLGSISVFAAEDGETNPWLDFYTLSEIPDYSFAVIGDIQSITYLDAHKETSYLDGMFDWILENKEARSIEYVFSLGDSVDTLISWPNEEPYFANEYNPLEWQTAATQFARLNGKIPYSVIRGNHDDEAGYHQYICTDDYKSQMDGFYYNPDEAAIDGNSMSNSYRKIEIYGQKYLMMTLDFDTNDGAIEWANNVIAANPDHKVIVSIHAYLYDERKCTEIGNKTNTSDNFFYKDKVGQPGIDDEEDGDTSHDYFMFDGQVFWDEIFSKHENVFMVLSGHIRDVEDPIIRTRKSPKGNHVFEILVNPQTYDEVNGNPTTDDEGNTVPAVGAGAFVMMLNFSNDGNKIEIEYISTATGKHFKAKNQVVKTVPGYSMMQLKSTTTTTAPAAVEEQKSGCKGAVLSTAAVTSVIGTSLAAFAMRKRKEND
ncbi:MAG: metallophosphoesterase [Clostridia bacterium]|nr:metallophosphoesterase [Clostridia bacterium]